MTLTQLTYVIEIANASSMNEAAKVLFISQPSLSESVQELEKELGIHIFIRSNKGVQLTPDGKEFLGYARAVVEQYALIESRYVKREQTKTKFSVSAQHYTFAINAFVELIRRYGMEEYDFSIFETKTGEIIDNVENLRSEVGILYLNDFNRAVLTKIFASKGLSFHPLFDCNIYVYLWKGHPLAHKKKIRMEELADYPCLAFDQGETNSFYFAEELFSTYDYKQIIHVSDRATILNLFVAINGFTLCSGIICEDLNGGEYCAVRLDSKELMTIGYIKKKGIPLSSLGALYIEEVSKYREQVLS
ncbi:MAG: LysR family transcriptional regulator [Lachnospiraceae bacterium]|nr:LysR family transcriptional regulator [Lachnospiraceae bacterium]